MFAVSGVMQASLLIMCLFWKARQHRLDIDDFGHPLAASIDSIAAEEVPGLVVDDSDDRLAVSAALASALASAAKDDVRTPSRSGSLEEGPAQTEESPLLGTAPKKAKGWFSRA